MSGNGNFMSPTFNPPPGLICNPERYMTVGSLGKKKKKKNFYKTFEIMMEF
jgi:hypothetical protein